MKIWIKDSKLLSCENSFRRVREVWCVFGPSAIRHYILMNDFTPGFSTWQRTFSVQWISILEAASATLNFR
jgi:hypothetical protein